MSGVDHQHLRLLEAVLFAATEPLNEAAIAIRLPDGADVDALLTKLARLYENRGVNLTRAGGRWAFRTAPDLAAQLRSIDPDKAFDPFPRNAIPYTWGRGTVILSSGHVIHEQR